MNWIVFISDMLIPYLCLTIKLCGANEAQRSLRPNERLVMQDYVQRQNTSSTHAFFSKGP